jgi:hypothetical protein
MMVSLKSPRHKKRPDDQIIEPFSEKITDVQLDHLSMSVGVELLEANMFTLSSETLRPLFLRRILSA